MYWLNGAIYSLPDLLHLLIMNRLGDIREGRCLYGFFYNSVACCSGLDREHPQSTAFHPQLSFKCCHWLRPSLSSDVQYTNNDGPREQATLKLSGGWNWHEMYHQSPWDHPQLSLKHLCCLRPSCVACDHIKDIEQSDSMKWYSLTEDGPLTKMMLLNILLHQS